MAKYLFSLALIVAFSFSHAQNDRIAQPDIPGDLLLDIGINYWTNDRDTLGNWGSRSIGIYYNRRLPINDHFAFYPAVGLTFERFSFKEDAHYRNDGTGNIVIDTVSGNFSRNKVIVTYLDVPLELRYHPRRTSEGEGFFIGAGIIGGLELGAKTKLRYDVNGERYREKLKGDFGMRNYRYGYVVRVGWRSFNFYFKNYLSNLYQGQQALVNRDLEPTGETMNPSVFTFGINFTGF